MEACIRQVRAMFPYAVIEVRIDAAFFSDEITRALHSHGVEFSITVPFERFPALKEKIEARRRWYHAGAGIEYFEPHWKPKSWPQHFRILVVRQKVPERTKGPVQLDLFIPHDEHYEFKVIVTNKTVNPLHVVRFHDGRGSQETLFGQGKSQSHMAYIPCRGRIPNQAYLLASTFAHNLTRLLQIWTEPPDRKTNPKRAPLWCFEALHTFRQNIIQKAGRLTRPHGALVLTMAAGDHLKERIMRLLDRVPANP
jgi:hypothetical protein